MDQKSVCKLGSFSIRFSNPSPSGTVVLDRTSTLELTNSKLSILLGTSKTLVLILALTHVETSL